MSSRASFGFPGVGGSERGLSGCEMLCLEYADHADIWPGGRPVGVENARAP